MKPIFFFCLGLLLPLAHAEDATTDAQFRVTRTVSQLEAAYARRHAVLDGTGRQPIALSSNAGLFPTYGFTPAAGPISWNFYGIDADHSVLALSMKVSSMSAWHGAIKGLQIANMSPAAEDYTSAAHFVIPNSFPATIYAVRIFDRRDYIVPTMLPRLSGISGILSSAKVIPAAVLEASPGKSATVSLTVSNLTAPTVVHGKAKKKEGLSVSVVGVEVREGFRVSHNCVNVFPLESCTVTVTYDGETPLKKKAASLRLEFSTGEFAVISLLGVTKGQ